MTTKKYTDTEAGNSGKTRKKAKLFKPVKHFCITLLLYIKRGMTVA